LLSKMSALTRPLSGMIWVAVLGAGAARNGRYRPEERARARPPKRSLHHDPKFNSVVLLLYQTTK